MNKKKKRALKQIEVGEWLYKGCYIQLSQHIELYGKYEVFKNNEDQDHVGRTRNFREAMKMCRENKCDDNFYKYD
jgi:hypothetical protein